MGFDKYISTTLPYANSVPHIGHALEFIQADALVQYFRNYKKEKVFFNTGIDENGLKVYTKAKELKIDTHEYLGLIGCEWIRFCRDFEIRFDNFYETSSKAHHLHAQAFWNQCLGRGDLYKKSYSGKYCLGCEAFKTDSELIDGKCPDHGTEPVITNEENWFFRLSKYRNSLIYWLKNEDSLRPESKIAELRKIIEQCEDISVSRLKKNVPWGIEVPGDPDQVIYVWFEALLNYIFCVKDFSDEYFIQLCGPDNLRFQGCLFQAILKSEGLHHSGKILVHGTVLDGNGKKMSKTVGNVIDPLDQLDKYGLDAVRYYALAGLTTYGDGSWIETDLIKKYNSELADDYGNLLARTLHLIDQKNVEIDFDRGILLEFTDRIVGIQSSWDNYEIHEALKKTNLLVQSANKYINATEPWKDGTGHTEVLTNLYYVLTEVADLYAPVLSSDTYARIKSALVSKKKEIIFKKIK